MLYHSDMRTAFVIMNIVSFGIAEFFIEFLYAALGGKGDRIRADLTRFLFKLSHDKAAEGSNRSHCR